MASYPENMSISNREEIIGRARLIPDGEVVNTITHGIGSVLSMIAAVILIRSIWMVGDWLSIFGVAVFAISMVTVYIASTLSHACAESNLRGLFRTLDQAFIYLLIVGTYSAIAFTHLRDGIWWIFAALMWGIALVGFISKLFFSHRIESVTVWSYVVLGWLPVIPTIYLFSSMPFEAILLLIGGGMCYTIGTIFLVLDKSQLHFHGIWHLMVIAGSTCHFFLVLRHVAV